MATGGIPADLVQQPEVGGGEQALRRAIPARRPQQRSLGSEALELLEAGQEDRPP